MSCKHKEYTKINVIVREYRLIAGTDKLMEVQSHICMRRQCGVLFVPLELRDIPQMDTIQNKE